MSLILYSLFILLSLYTILLLWLALGFIRSNYFTVNNKKTLTPLTLIICARNEEKNIGICLNSILKQDYALNKIQILLINDASSDNTRSVAETILNKSGVKHTIVSNSEKKGKKESISQAMRLAENELIVLRDADTFTLSKNWLQSISDFYQQTHSDLIIAPVAIANNTGLLWALQAIENNVLTVIGNGAAHFKKPFLCNGANLIFTRTMFTKTQGYSSHININSGDDIFFLEDVKKVTGSRINYLKSTEAVVYTYPCYSFKSLLQQKIRWASKFKSNSNKLNFTLSLLTAFVNLGWLLCFAFINLPAYKELCLMFIVFKLLIDNLLLFLASGFIKNKNLLWYCLPVGCIYPIYACIVGVLSLFVKPRWK